MGSCFPARLLRKLASDTALMAALWCLFQMIKVVKK